jgi:hypothetical protein
MIEIFGKNLLDEEKQYDGYEELVGLTNHKPFECVGEIEESVLAFSLLRESEFKNDFIVKKILNKLEGLYNFTELKNKYLSI